MAAGGPGVIGISDRQIDNPVIAIIVRPRRARDSFAPKKVMLDAGKDAAPVTAVQSFVNHSVDFHINSIALDDLVIYAAK